MSLAKTEVQHLQASVVTDHHVARLQIAVRDAARMRGGHGVGERNRDLEELRQRHPSGRNQFRQRAPLDELHGQHGRAVVLLDRMDGDDVRMGQRGNGTRLALKPIAVGRVSRARVMKSLQRDEATQLLVARLEDLTHATLAELFEDAIGSDPIPCLHRVLVIRFLAGQRWNYTRG